MNQASPDLLGPVGRLVTLACLVSLDPKDAPALLASQSLVSTSPVTARLPRYLSNLYFGKITISNLSSYPSIHSSIYVCMYVCMFVCMYICMYLPTYICLSVYLLSFYPSIYRSSHLDPFIYFFFASIMCTTSELSLAF